MPTLQRAPVFSTLFTMGHMLVMLAIASLPSVILNLPVGVLAKVWARWRQRLALARSDVKLKAHDVLLSEKLKFAIVAVPCVWLSYAALLLYRGMEARDVLTLLMVAPIASYFGVISVESGMIALRDLRPMLCRLLYSRQVQIGRGVRTRVPCGHAEAKAPRGSVHADAAFAYTMLGMRQRPRPRRLGEARLLSQP